MNNSEHHPEFIDLVLKTMNRRHGLALTTEQKVDTNYGKSEVFDLADKSMSTYIEVISGANVANRNKVVDRVNKLSKALINSLRGSRQDTLHLIFENEIDQEERKYYASKFKSGNRIKYEFLDKKNILDFANAFKFSIPDFGDLKNGNVNELPPSNFEEDVIDGMTLDERRASLAALREDSTIGYFEEFKGNYWWLNAAERFWPLGDAKMGSVYTYPKFGEKILRRNANAIKVGDFAIAYQKAPEQRLTSVYRVVESEDDNILSFKLVHELTRFITWDELLEIKLFADSNIRGAKANGSFYPLSKELFIELIRKTSSFFSLSNDIDSFERQTENNTPTKLTRSEVISTDHGTKDSLGFTKDVQSLAALIALKDMKPPLAIALFGKWGSGKSFFMDSLEQRIRELSKYQGFIESEGDLSEVKEDEVFLNGIAHIKFNAWSYMDANLWAGLAHSLFEKLDQYITDNTKGEIERAKVNKQINEHLEYLNRDLELQVAKFRDLNRKKIILEKEREQILLKWFKPKYDVKMRAFLKHNGIGEDELEHYLPSKLRKYVEKSIGFVNYLKGNGYQVTIWILGIIAIIWALKVLIVPILPESLLYLKSIWAYVSLTIVTPLVFTLRYIVRYRKLITSLLILSNEEESLKKEDVDPNEQEEIKQEIQKTNETIIALENKIVQEEHLKQNLNDRAIENLISEIPAKDDYVKHLGIITTIRRDFETLSDLFSYRDKEINETLSDREKVRIEELNEARKEIGRAFEENRKLNRIVLYIDDLDRCSDEKVLQVLQAVHLLMAFPLFTVVVGVDERSVHNALMYQQLKRYQNVNKELVDEYIKEIEPREYLEKIFQIPFQLPEATDNGVEQLINDIIPYPVFDSSDEMGDVEMGDSELIEKGMRETPNEEPEEGENETPLTVGGVNTDYLRLTKTVQPEEIRITSREKEYLQLFAPLVGNNPRTVKRYINIFRIVKTHELNNFNETDSTLKVAFLIAFYTGKHRIVAVNFLKRDHNLRLNAYLSSTAGEANEKTEEGKLLLLIESMQHKEMGVKQILNMPKGDHLKLFSFIERFSYKLDSQIENK